MDEKVAFARRMISASLAGRAVGTLVERKGFDACWDDCDDVTRSDIMNAVTSEIENFFIEAELAMDNKQ